MDNTQELLNVLLESEISEIRKTIDNESIWEAGYTGGKPNPHTGNIATFYQYLGLLKRLRNGPVTAESVSEIAESLDDETILLLLKSMLENAISQYSDGPGSETEGCCLSGKCREAGTACNAFIAYLKKLNAQLPEVFQ